MTTRNPLEMRPLASDERLLAVNLIQSILSLRALEPDAEDTAELHALPDSFRTRHGEFWAMDLQGQLIGTIGARPTAETGEWEIKWLCMAPAWQRMGIGRMLVERAIEFARANGASRIRAEVHTVLPEAYHLFTDLEFHSVESFDPETYAGPILLRRIYS